jgi:uncharacterized UPF0160 family protein
MTNKTVRIGTHDSSFHCDDVLAVAVLSTIFPNHSIVRSRDQDVLDFCDILVDVGGTYDNRSGRYDHHMSDPPRDRSGQLLSSAGLIWRHYSRAYLQSIGIPKTFTIGEAEYDLITAVEQNINKFWITPIDLSDNGVSKDPTPITELVRSMRPTDPEKSHSRFNELFLDTVSMVAMLFKRACFHSADWIISKTQCDTAEMDYIAEGRIVISQYPVTDYRRFASENAHFVICPVREYKGSEALYVIRPISPLHTRNSRSPLPSGCWGCREDAIEEYTGIKGITYIHHTGFLALARSKEAAIDFCHYVLNRKR